VTARVSVWVRDGSDLAVQDQHLWLITVVQNDGRPLVWQGEAETYSNGKAHFGHWEAEMPPGFYVISAHRREDREVTHTNEAVVEVGCEGDVCVLLRPDRRPRTGEEDEGSSPGSRGRRPPPKTCTVSIGSVTARSNDRVSIEQLLVGGTASGCSKVVVSVRRERGLSAAAESEADVDKDRWVAGFSSKSVDVACGDRIVVVAECVGGDCGDEWRGTLECTPVPPR
jgi:hypothetical protein